MYEPQLVLTMEKRIIPITSLAQLYRMLLNADGKQFLQENKTAGCVYTETKEAEKIEVCAEYRQRFSV